MRDLRADVRIP